MDTNEHGMIDGKPLTDGEISLIRALRNTTFLACVRSNVKELFGSQVVCFHVSHPRAAFMARVALREIEKEHDKEAGFIDDTDYSGTPYFN